MDCIPVCTASVHFSDVPQLSPGPHTEYSTLHTSKPRGKIFSSALVATIRAVPLKNPRAGKTPSPEKNLGARGSVGKKNLGAGGSKTL